MCNNQWFSSCDRPISCRQCFVANWGQDIYHDFSRFGLILLVCYRLQLRQQLTSLRSVFRLLLPTHLEEYGYVLHLVSVGSQLQLGPHQSFSFKVWAVFCQSIKDLMLICRSRYTLVLCCQSHDDLVCVDTYQVYILRVVCSLLLKVIQETLAWNRDKMLINRENRGEISFNGN